MTEQPGAMIYECACLRRYMRTAVQLDVAENDSALCACGETLGSWDGAVRFEYEPEEDAD